MTNNQLAVVILSHLQNPKVTSEARSHYKINYAANAWVGHRTSDDGYLRAPENQEAIEIQRRIDYTVQATAKLRTADLTLALTPGWFANLDFPLYLNDGAQHAPIHFLLWKAVEKRLSKEEQELFEQLKNTAR